MIEGGMGAYVIAAYAVSGVLLGGLVLVLSLRARYWAKRARELERKP